MQLQSVLKPPSAALQLCSRRPGSASECYFPDISFGSFSVAVLLVVWILTTIRQQRQTQENTMDDLGVFVKSGSASSVAELVGVGLFSPTSFHEIPEKTHLAVREKKRRVATLGATDDVGKSRDQIPNSSNSSGRLHHRLDTSSPNISFLDLPCCLVLGLVLGP